MEKIAIGVSDCLLGSEVRFNGGHRHHRYITDTLGQYFTFIPYCTEVAIGLGVPRPPIRLVGTTKVPRAVGIDDATMDVTDKLSDYSEKTTKTLPNNLCGFIVKSKSPSCGMERVKIYNDKGIPSANGTGLFTHALLKNNPTLPVEEEGRLGDPLLRENFIERVYVLYRWHKLQPKLDAKHLLEFHTQHKLSLMAHHPKPYQELGQRLADVGNQDIHSLTQDYIQALMKAFTIKATRKTNTNVLQHCSGYLKNELDTHDKAELHLLIQRYYDGDIPLVVPITLRQHYFRKFPNDYMNQQTFLNPYPGELRLRNLL